MKKCFAVGGLREVVSVLGAALEIISKKGANSHQIVIS